MSNDKVKFDETSKEIDKALKKNEVVEFKPVDQYSVGDRIRFAHEIKTNPPKPGFMKIDVEPKIYSIDLNTDAHWWFNHTCTVFPLLLDQAKRTHVDIRDSFKPEKRLPDFNIMFIVILIVGLVGVMMITKTFGWW